MARDAKARSATKTVLLADDDAAVREVLMRLLVRLGFRVLTAADGREAVDAFGDAQPAVDLVLLDLSMPMMGGEAAFGEIHRLRPEVPVIFISGSLEDSLVARYQAQGLAGALAKPVTLARLRDYLESVLGGSPQVQP
jgi:CheY-like chemotaxis protein